MEENSLPGIVLTLIVRKPDLKLFFWLRSIRINTVSSVNYRKERDKHIYLNNILLYKIHIYTRKLATAIVEQSLFSDESLPLSIMTTQIHTCMHAFRYFFCWCGWLLFKVQLLFKINMVTMVQSGFLSIKV